ncbi:hypothetical protein [Streptomyces coeruleorubidus]|uniref:hypothetical protein n=1 Tax=Streptomyces coeruleorubidus TaxID=116188 RepID=UPI003F53F24A
MVGGSSPGVVLVESVQQFVLAAVVLVLVDAFLRQGPVQVDGACRTGAGRSTAPLGGRL